MKKAEPSYSKMLAFAIRIQPTVTFANSSLRSCSQYHSIGRGPGQLSQYSDSLPAGRSRDRIPVRDEIFRIRPDRSWDPPGLLYNGYGVFTGVQLPGRDVDHPLPSSAEIKKRVELYFTPPLGLRGLIQGERYLSHLNFLLLFAS
jgi:hypothetical protein